MRAGKLPSEMKAAHTWRTREDPFCEHWDELAAMLVDAPELEAKSLFEWLCDSHPGVYHEGQLRTFQRRVREWRALHGPEKEVYFPQVHVPGERMETDFTWMNELNITILGEPFPHKVCHSVLTYSNWQWGTVCHSESYLALKKGFQTAVFRLGHVPVEHWTDHSTGATHPIGQGGNDNWAFNKKYEDLMDHFDVTPRTIGVGKPHEDGDVESANGVLKRRMEQHLLLRGHRDFASREEYVAFLEDLFERANARRHKRLDEELDAMRLLDVRLLPEYTEEEARVTSWSTIQVDKRAYSVPSRLQGERLRVHVYDDRLEVYFHGVHQQAMPRLTGDRNHAINYRHVIGTLIRKPGAFPRYRYRDDLFPSSVFRWAHDALCEKCSTHVADREYLRILHHAAQTMESRVEQVLLGVRARNETPRWHVVEQLATDAQPVLPAQAPLVVDLTVYDSLLGGEKVSA
jgi:hypothetical protein